MKHKRTLISLMLAFTFILALPVQSFAQEGTVTTTSSDFDEITCSDPYVFDGPDGMTYVGYEITNNSSKAIYVAQTVQFRDEDYNNIGEVSSYIPCVASGEVAFIFVPNYYGTRYSNLDTGLFYGISDYESATWGLSEIQVEEGDDCFTFTAHNNTYDPITLPTITVVYWLDAMPVAAYSGSIANSSGEDCIISKQDGSVTIAKPDIEYDDALYYVTAFFDDTEDE